MRQADIYFKDQKAGTLLQQDDGSFLFQYLPNWVEDPKKSPISLTLPKTAAPYRSSFLFPFFYNLLPEGSNKELVCRANRLDPNDDFGLLMISAAFDAAGAVTVRKL